VAAESQDSKKLKELLAERQKGQAASNKERDELNNERDQLKREGEVREHLRHESQYGRTNKTTCERLTHTIRANPYRTT
jgi:hypothetical protein